MLKIIQQAKNGVTYAKPHATKLEVNYSLGPPRNGMVKQELPGRPLPSPKGK